MLSTLGMRIFWQEEIWKNSAIRSEELIGKTKGKGILMILIVVVIHDAASARRIADGLLEKRCIAGYNMLPVSSGYWWKGEILRESETVLLLKSSEGRVREIEDFVKEESGYEVPEFLTLKPQYANSDYLRWITGEASKAT